jgi:hypothetical protein
MELVTDNVKTLESKDKEIRKDLLEQMLQELQQVTDDTTIAMCVHREGELLSYSTVDAANTHALYTIFCNVMLDDIFAEL